MALISPQEQAARQVRQVADVAQQSREKWQRMKQAEAEELARKQQAQAEAEAFHQQVTASREKLAAGYKVDMSDVPTLDEQFRELTRAEQERTAALQPQPTPRDVWLSTLPFQERERISKWEQINRMEYPMPSALQPSR